MANLKDRYSGEIAPKLREELGLANVMEVPRITKITLNMGVGEAVGDKKIMENAVGDMTRIAGQKPVVTVARKSIAGFKIRDGWPIGCKATLRRERMYEFLERLISIAIPRIRDFRGISPKSFDGRGNFAMGVSEQIISRRSTTTRWIRCAGWTSRSPRRRGRTRRAGPFCAPSTSP